MENEVLEEVEQHDMSVSEQINAEIKELNRIVDALAEMEAQEVNEDSEVEDVVISELEESDGNVSEEFDNSVSELIVESEKELDSIDDEVHTEMGSVDKDAEIRELNAFIDQAVKLFGNMRKGYPVTAQVKLWVDSVSKRK